MTNANSSWVLFKIETQQMLYQIDVPADGLASANTGSAQIILEYSDLVN